MLILQLPLPLEDLAAVRAGEGVRLPLPGNSKLYTSYKSNKPMSFFHVPGHVAALDGRLADGAVVGSVGHHQSHLGDQDGLRNCLGDGGPRLLDPLGVDLGHLAPGQRPCN
jgi:hypothetical protein